MGFFKKTITEPIKATRIWIIKLALPGSKYANTSVGVDNSKNRAKKLNFLKKINISRQDN